MNDYVERMNKVILDLKDKDVDCGQVSDGYHTFDELYDFRKVYNACLFNMWFEAGKYDCHKSKLHNDGEKPFGKDNMFIVVADLPSGQISNHYHIEDWDLFKIEETEKAKFEFDGHTPADVLDRLLKEIDED